MGGAEGSPALDPRLAAVMRKMRMDLAIAEVVEALREAGIPCILLKGPSTARWLYDPGELRTYIDIDLLVPFPRNAAGAVLEQLGFAPCPPETGYAWRPAALGWMRAVDLCQGRTARDVRRHPRPGRRGMGAACDAHGGHGRQRGPGPGARCRRASIDRRTARGGARHRALEVRHRLAARARACVARGLGDRSRAGPSARRGGRLLGRATTRSRRAKSSPTPSGCRARSPRR